MIGEQAEDQRGHGHAEVGHLQQPSLGDPVGDHAGERREQQERQELETGGDADGGAAVAGQLEDQPVLGDPLHPGADVRHDAAGGVPAVVRVGEGAERGAQVVGISPSGRAFEDGGGLAEHGPLVGGQLAQALGQPGVAAGAVGEHGLAAPVGQRDHHLAAVGVVRAAGDVPALLEAVDGAGHARRLHPLVGGQLADGQLAVAVEAAQHRHRAEAELVVGVALVGEPAAQPHHGDAGARRRARRRCGRPAGRWACP